MQENILCVTDSGVARFTARNEFRKEVEEHRDRCTQMLRQINRAAEDFDYDPMNFVLGTVLGTLRYVRKHHPEETSEEVLQYLVRVFTGADLIFEADKNIRKMLNSGSSEMNPDTLWRYLQKDSDKK